MYRNYNFNSRELLDVVDKAIKSKEFQQLSSQVAHVVNKSINEASRAAAAARAQMEQAAQNKHNAQKAQPQDWQHSQPQMPHGSYTNHVPHQYSSQQGSNQQVNAPYMPQVSTAQRASHASVNHYAAQPHMQPAQPLQQYAPNSVMPFGPAYSTQLYSKKSTQRLVGISQSIVGFSGALFFGVVELSCILLLLVDGFDAIGCALAVFFGGLLAGSIALGSAGIHRCNLIARFKHVIRVIGNRTSCTIDELCHGFGRDANRVLKDVKEMIRRGYFTQARLDSQEKILFVSADAYQQYALQAQQAAHQAQLDAADKQRQQQLPAACRDILKEGKQYIQFIHDANDKLPGETISAKLDRLEAIIARIFSEVEKDPSTADDLKQFMNYYLPTTKKLVQTYCDLENEPIPSDKMKQTKQEIESALDTINRAFETLLDDLFHDTALDISSDIQVLNTMLAQEGLANNGFSLTK